MLSLLLVCSRRRQSRLTTSGFLQSHGSRLQVSDGLLISDGSQLRRAAASTCKATNTHNTHGHPCSQESTPALDPTMAAETQLHNFYPWQRCNTQGPVLARKGTTARMRTSGGHRALDSDIGQPTSDPLPCRSHGDFPGRASTEDSPRQNRGQQPNETIRGGRPAAGWLVCVCGTSAAGPAASGKRPEERHTRYQSWSLCVASIGLCDGLLLACGCPSSLTGSVNFESSPQAYLGRRGLMRGAVDAAHPHTATHTTHTTYRCLDEAGLPVLRQQ